MSESTSILALDQIEERLDVMMSAPALSGRDAIVDRSAELLDLADAVLANWVLARAQTPTEEVREGFRLLALHRQGAKGEPSFNACRETCREVAWHFNLLNKTELTHEKQASLVVMMTMLVRHLVLFVSGKLVEKGLGDFCCASRPLRSNEADSLPTQHE